MALPREEREEVGPPEASCFRYSWPWLLWIHPSSRAVLPYKVDVHKISQNGLFPLSSSLTVHTKTDKGAWLNSQK